MSYGNPSTSKRSARSGVISSRNLPRPIGALFASGSSGPVWHERHAWTRFHYDSKRDEDAKWIYLNDRFRGLNIGGELPCSLNRRRFMNEAPQARATSAGPTAAPRPLDFVPFDAAQLERPLAWHFEQQGCKQPDHLAIQTGALRITYAELETAPPTVWRTSFSARQAPAKLQWRC